jgi:uncharacterized protein
MRGALAVALLVIGAAPANAFDCTKAGTDIEKTICGDADALAANDRMEKAYFELRDRLGETERKLLLDNQKAWLHYRDSCGADGPLCIGEASETRAVLLESTRPGMVPFTLFQKGVEDGYEVTISGYHFINPTDPAEIAYEDWVKARIADTPYGQPPEKTDDEHPPYNHEVVLEVPRLTGRLLSAVAYSQDYSGGAHGNSWSTSVNLDRASGSELSASGLFDDDGLKSLADDCARQIVESYSDMYDGMSQDEALAELEKTYPGAVAEHLGDMTRWHFDEEGGLVRFDPYAVAPYAGGPAECRFSYDELRPLASQPEILSDD